MRYVIEMYNHLLKDAQIHSHITHWIFQETKGAKVVRKAAKAVRKVERKRAGKTPVRAKAVTKAKQRTSTIFCWGGEGCWGWMVGKEG